MICCTSLEERFQGAVRSNPFLRRCLALACITSVLVIISLPQLITGRLSFEDARDECWVRLVDNTERHWGFTHSEALEWNYANAAHDLNYIHTFNSAATVVSLLSWCLWLFHSPYKSLRTRTLDQKLGSFFTLQLIGNMTVTSFSLYICVETDAVGIVQLLNNICFFGMSVLGTNLLCHRYLYEKAFTMNLVLGFDAENSSSWLSLRNLKSTLKWECKVFYVLPILVIFYPVFPKTTLLAAGVVGLCVLLSDLLFTVIITRIFLKSIGAAMDLAGDQQRQTEGFKGMETTKWMTFAGSTLAVFSSTVAYVNYIMFVWSQRGSIFWTDNLLHPYVFGLNMDSVCNNIGMLLACAIFKKMFWKSTRGETTIRASVAVVPTN